MSISRAQAHVYPEVVCPKCAVIDVPAIEHGNWGGNRIKATCRHCGAFAKWESDKTPEQRRAARQRGVNDWMATQPPTAAQLAYLRVLGHDCTPANRLEASETIDALLRKGVAQ